MAKKAPIDHGPLVDFLIARTGKMAAIYKDALKEPARPKLTKKAAALQALIDGDNFGCQSAAVASAFSILTGEPITPKRKKPEIEVDDQIPGLCVVCHTSESSWGRFTPNVVLISMGYRFSSFFRADTCRVKDSGIKDELEGFRFATPAEIREAVARMSTETASLLTLSLLK